ncbi:MAG TPA: bifunctional tetrahydrofolate synthase/dihydrofolate synthase [Steroidobacteraceae bacterium]|nr:bifunctional tetrahydrofolate synthase/dihydrofolate synthase [Steroidobacteraceae bacterium]
MSALAAWLERQEKSHPSAIDLGLTRVREVARRMGLLTPAHRVITVGGTNGKGSTVAFVDGFLRAGGKRVGRFTSPHLTRYNERICIDGAEARDEELIASFQRIDAARGDITLTFFEYNALAALDLFARAKVDVAVLEVGLGGRLDATNIIDADVSVVTSIGIDHVDWLGHSAAGIAREKAGIFRAGRPAVLGSVDMPRSMFDVIDEVKARACLPGRDYQVSAHAQSWDFEFGALQLRGLPRPALAGHLQLTNAATALAALVCAGFTLDQDVISRALRDTRIRGRFQVIPGDIEWVLDVAHNVPAAEALRINLASLPPRRTQAVCGVLGDKDIAGITAAIAPAIDTWTLTGLEGPRAISTRDLESHLPAGAVVIARETSVAAACRAALAAAAPGERIVVFGSFLTVGPALEFLGI